MNERGKIYKKDKKYKGLEKNEEEGKKMRAEEKNTKCLTCKTRTCKIAKFRVHAKSIKRGDNKIVK